MDCHGVVGLSGCCFSGCLFLSWTRLPYWVLLTLRQCARELSKILLAGVYIFGHNLYYCMQYSMISLGIDKIIAP